MLKVILGSDTDGVDAFFPYLSFQDQLRTLYIIDKTNTRKLKNVQKTKDQLGTLGNEEQNVAEFPGFSFSCIPQT